MYTRFLVDIWGNLFHIPCKKTTVKCLPVQSRWVTFYKYSVTLWYWNSNPIVMEWSHCLYTSEEYPRTKYEPKYAHITMVTIDTKIDCWWLSLFAAFFIHNDIVYIIFSFIFLLSYTVLKKSLEYYFWALLVSRRSFKALKINIFILFSQYTDCCWHQQH